MPELLTEISPYMLIGVILILINFPLGWAGLAGFMHLAKKTGKKVFCFLGIAVYAFSWIVFFAGVFLCGKEYASLLCSKFHTHILLITITTAAAAVILSRYLLKSHSKINEKALN